LKLLFDHHLSPTLIVRLAGLFPGSEHVWNLALHDQPDTAVWLYARDHEFTIVSKDLIWLQIDNWSTDQIEELIRSSHAKILALRDSTDRAILVLYKSRTLTK
jgi:predicted nuclease of predicted toxin-antitoxin system